LLNPGIIPPSVDGSADLGDYHSPCDGFGHGGGDTGQGDGGGHH
jgi:hypothetical protein